MERNNIIRYSTLSVLLSMMNGATSDDNPSVNSTQPTFVRTRYQAHVQTTWIDNEGESMETQGHCTNAFG